jgi:hypothetical protein
MLSIVELLKLRGLETDARVKLVRHQDKRYDLAELVREGLFEIYQSSQSKPVFECDYIVSFLGTENSKARLMGVYRVAGKSPYEQNPLAPDFKYPELASPGGYRYVLEEVGGFEDLKGRVIIDWGRSALAWHQWLTEKEVVEVLPAGYVREFPGYLDFVLSYEELVAIINNPDANREWHRMLSAVAGVYLITDLKTGRQYVGSATGEGGVLGRWAVYARVPHGGNKLLKELLAEDGEHARNFQYTVLRTLPRTLTIPEVVRYEILYKRKLGTRAFGLNSN